MKVLSLLILALFVASCGTTVHKMSSYCKTPPEQLFNQLIVIGAESGLNVKMNDPKSGLLQLESDMNSNFWLNTNTTNRWFVQYTNDTIKAFAKSSMQTKNAFGGVTSTSETYYNDNAHKDWLWYWNVRNRIQQVCGSTIIFTETESN